MLGRTWTAILVIAVLSGLIGLIDLLISLIDWANSTNVSGGTMSTTVVGAGFLAMSFVLVVLMEIFEDMDKDSYPPPRPRYPPYSPPPPPPPQGAGGVNPPPPIQLTQ
jgi:hypothetical protein